MRRALLSCAAIVLAIACGDNITEPIPDRTVTQATSISSPVAFATTTTEDGLSISTDKDDYQPGDTVHFTGSGWPANDVLDIQLDDEPATHAPHTWAVNVGEDGMFHDSTYVVDVGDLGVTFTLKATSRATGRSLTVTFTDGPLQFRARPTPALASFSVSATSLDYGDVTCTTLQGNGNPQSPTILTTQTGQFVNSRNQNQSMRLTVPLTVGSYTFSGITQSEAGESFIVSSTATATSQVVCIKGTQGGSNSRLFFLDYTAAPTPTKLGFTTDPRTAAVGQCTAVLTVQSQQSDAAPANVASNTALTLTSSSAGGSFHTNAACTTSGAVSIASGTNSASFFYKDADAGTPLITVAATGLTSATQNQNITAGNALVTVTASPVSPTVFGQSVSFTAAVTAVAPAVGTPTGSVTFHDGAACSDPQIGASKTLSGGSTTSDATTSLSVDNHTITACYGGGGSFSAQAGQIAHTVNKALTSVSLTKNPVGNTVYSQAVVFTATVGVTGLGAGTPDGTVKFYELAAGGTCDAPSGLLGTGTLVSGEAELSISTLPASATPHAITACYEGSTNFEKSGNSINHTVDQASTTTTVVSSDDESVFSQPVTFTATVAAVAPAVTTPVGNVTFHDGAACSDPQIGAAKTLSGSGSATSDATGSLSVGSHTITACYAGNTNFEASDGNASQLVEKASTTTAVVSSDDESVFSQPVTFTATVAAVAPALATPTGSVTFHDGAACSGAQIGAAKTLSGGSATSDATGSLSVGSHTITACYAETANFKESNGNVTQTVDQALTTTAVTTSGSPSVLHQPVTFDVTVSPVAPALATPEGNVTLKDGTCAAGTTVGGPTALNGSGQASFSVSTLAVGLHTVSACYAGNASFEGSSGSVAQGVTYNFSGLFAPVDRPNTMNVSKAGQGVPLKWRLTDYYGAPVLDFSPTALGVAVSGLVCTIAASLDQIEEYAGNSGLQNLGDGYYQFNWKTPSSYANTCKAIGLNLGEGVPRGPLAYFNFKK